MQTIFHNPTGDLIDIYTQSAALQAKSVEVKSAIQDCINNLDAAEHKVAGLEKHIAELIYFETASIYPELKIDVKFLKYGEPLAIELTTYLFLDGGRKKLNLFGAKVGFQLVDDQCCAVERSIRTDLFDDQEESCWDFDAGVNCDVVPPTALVASMKSCVMFSDALSTPNNLCQMFLALIDADTERRARQMAFDIAIEGYPSTLLQGFVSDYRALTAGDIKALWNAPEGSEIRFVKISSSQRMPSTGVLDTVFYHSPYVIRVTVSGDSKKLVASREHGFCSWMYRQLENITASLYQGDYLQIQDDLPVLGRSVIASPNLDFAKIRSRNTVIFKP